MNSFIRYSFALIFLFSFTKISSATFTCVVSAFDGDADDWNDGGTWGNASPGIIGIDFPGPGDVVNIPAYKTVTIPAGYAASAATLSLNSNNGSQETVLLFATSTSSLSISSNVSMNSSVAGCKTAPVNPVPAASIVHQIILNGGTMTIGGALTMTAFAGTCCCASDDQQTIILGGGTLSVSGNLTMSNSGTMYATIDMTSANSVLNVGAGFTIGRILNNTGASGSINYTGSGGQTILSAITYYDLGTSGTGLKTLNGNTTVKGTFTMTSGNINLNTLTLTLGISGAARGTLTHTSGWMYNGTFKRWFDNSVSTIGDAMGHFPVGSNIDYRPLWLAEGITFGIPSFGTISVSHEYDYTWPAHIAATHNDASWGFSLAGVSKSRWLITTADGYFHTNLSIRYGGQGFGTNVLSDLNASLSASVVGTHSAATGAGNAPYVNRTGIGSADLNNTFRLGSKNLAQSPLPVNFVSFDVEAFNNHVNLKWITFTEINNDYFTLERSADGSNFYEIKIIDGAGNSNHVTGYYESDEDPLPGISYYRLKQTDFDGSNHYSRIVSVNYKKRLFTVSPNPATNTINVNFHNLLPDDSRIKIIDILGRDCLNMVLSSNRLQTIPLNEDIFVPGLYYIMFHIPGEEIYKRSIMVQ